MLTYHHKQLKSLLFIIFIQNAVTIPERRVIALQDNIIAKTVPI